MRILSLPELKSEKGVPYSRPHLYRLVRAEKFPAPVHLGKNRIGFVEDEIDNWLEDRLAERPITGAAA